MVQFSINNKSMKVIHFCKNYFTPLARKDANGKVLKHRKAIAVLKIASYALAGLIPLAIGLVYGAATLANRVKKQKPEYSEFSVFSRLRAFAMQCSLSEKESLEFIQLVAKINGMIDDETIIKHYVRMGNPDQLQKRYLELSGEAKSLHRLHEVFELLALKWERNKGFDEVLDEGDFLHAHVQAIRIENHYMMIKAKEMGISLTANALNYIRFVDEVHLMCGIAMGEFEIQECVEILTKKKEELPTFNEMRALVDYHCLSGVLDKLIGRDIIQRMVWSRYLFTILHEEFSQSHEKILLLLFYYIEKQGFYSNYDPQALLDALRKAITELDPKEKAMIESNFLSSMEQMCRGESLHFLLKSLIDKFVHRIDKSVV